MSKNIKFIGTGVAIITPFSNKDNTIDYKSLGKLVDFVIKGGVEYIVVLGTTGESVTLSKEEKQSIVTHVIENVDKPEDVALFDLSTDIRETNNIATQHPDIVEKMKAIMKEQHSPSIEFPFKSEVVKK